ncbi:hypothetical protein P2318_07705 [Myxococcaceae bacterium GXIMD 01537]
MKATVLAGAIAALMWGASARAQATQPVAQDPPSGDEAQGTGGAGMPQGRDPESGDLGEDSPDVGESSTEPGGDISQEPTFDPDAPSNQDSGTGGAGDMQGEEPQQSPPPARNEPATGGSGDLGEDSPDVGENSTEPGGDISQEPYTPGPQGEVGMGGFDATSDVEVQSVPIMPPGIALSTEAGPSEGAELLSATGLLGPPASMFEAELGEPGAVEASNVTPADVGVTESQEAVGGAGREPAADMRGVTVLIGGGVEGYTGDLAPEVNLGGTAGVSATLRPSTVLGVELGYSGALNELDERFGDVRGTGADIVRNGGRAAVTLGLTASPLQPYVLGGVGVDFYNIRHGESVGFQDDTVGTVPVGAGVRSHLGQFTADARVGYNFLFGQQFAPTGDDTGGSYTGTLSLGGTF